MIRDRAISQALYTINRITALTLLLKCSQSYLMDWKDDVWVSTSSEVILFRINVVLHVVELGLTIAGMIQGNAWRALGLLVDRIVLGFFFLSC